MSPNPIVPAALVAVCVTAATAQDRTISDVYETAAESHWILEQGGAPLGHVWLYVAGPSIGAAVAAVVFRRHLVEG